MKIEAAEKTREIFKNHSKIEKIKMFIVSCKQQS